MISRHGLSAVMGTLQVGHWFAFLSHMSIQDEQNTWWLAQITGCLTCKRVRSRHTNTNLHVNDPHRKLAERKRVVERHRPQLDLGSAQPGRAEHGVRPHQSSGPGARLLPFRGISGTRSAKSDRESTSGSWEPLLQGGGNTRRTQTVHNFRWRRYKFPTSSPSQSRGFALTTGSQRGQSSCDFSANQWTIKARTAHWLNQYKVCAYYNINYHHRGCFGKRKKKKIPLASHP